MGNRVIFVIVDGMRDDTARAHMGFMEGLVEKGVALRAQVNSVLPSISRVCYEAIMTGTDPMENGIVDNGIVRTSRMESIFEVLRKHGKESALAAYYWMSELYRRAPFHYVEDVEQDHMEESFTYGRFYFEDTFPDKHLFALAERMRVAHHPDLLVIHPMNTDDAGHKHGSDSPQYQASVATVDAILAHLVPTWLEEKYTVVVTADHGMDPHGFHGGTDPGVRTVPFYVMAPDLKVTGRKPEVLDQTTLAHFMCLRLGVLPAATMHPFPTEIYNRWF